MISRYHLNPEAIFLSDYMASDTRYFCWVNIQFHVLLEVYYWKNKTCWSVGGFRLIFHSTKRLQSASVAADNIKLTDAILGALSPPTSRDVCLLSPKVYDEQTDFHSENKKHFQILPLLDDKSGTYCSKLNQMVSNERPRKKWVIICNFISRKMKEWKFHLFKKKIFT